MPTLIPIRVATSRFATRRLASRRLANRRLALAVFGVAATATTILTSLVPATVARADETADRLVSDFINTSDPYAIACSDPASGFVGTCLYTSSDVGTPVSSSNGNPYPMAQTRLFTLPQGADPSVQSHWTSRGVVFDESQITIPNGGFVPPGADHLWAPTVTQDQYGDWLMYVPDVADDTPAGQDTSSEVAIAMASSPFGPFVYTGDQVPISTYASDPDVFQTADGGQFMAYADGDFNNCGGVSMVGLSTDMVDITTSPQQVQIEGIGLLGNCQGKGRPYLEGPQIYDTRFWGNPEITGPYLMVVAAKPDHVPTECAGIPEPNTNNEVLAYATATDPAGPYVYQGILMCGSKTEWTDQGSLLPMPDKTGTYRLVMFYHDGPAGQPNRMVHAECLYYGPSDMIGLATRSQDWTNIGFSTPTFSSCMANSNHVNDSTVALTLIGRDFITNPRKYVTAESGGGADLVYNRYAIGNWEQFHIAMYNNNQSFGFQSRANGRWVSTLTDGHLLANAANEMPTQGNPATGFNVLPGTSWSGIGSCATFFSATTNDRVGLDVPGLLYAFPPVGSLSFCPLHL
jgi:hypothetical protein